MTDSTWQHTTTGSEGATYLSHIEINFTRVSPTTEAGWWRWLGNAVQVWRKNLSLTEIIARHKGIPHEVRMAMLDRLLPHIHAENVLPPTDDARAMLAYLLAEETAND